MSIKSSSLITDGLPLDDTKPPSVKTASDRTDPGVGQTARTRVTGSSPLLGVGPDAPRQGDGDRQREIGESLG
jgi:hypothetical protein